MNSPETHKRNNENIFDNFRRSSSQQKVINGNTLQPLENQVKSYSKYL
jgi:hypothetical protein